MENSTINPAPPHLAGLTWRAISRDDLAAIGELAAECQRIDGGLAFLNEPGNLKDRYFPDAAGVAIGAFAGDGQLAACSTVHLIREADTERARIIGQVRPDWRNRGIGAYLLRWSQTQALALFSPATVNMRLLQVATESLTEPARHLYHAHGFEAVMEELVMKRELGTPLPDYPLPRDLTITSWQPELAEQFFQAYAAAFRERPGFPGWSAAEWISRNNADDDFMPEWSLLARAGEAPVGFLTADAVHPGGYVAQVGVVPGQRRRGLGSALLVETMRRMQAAGEPTAQLVVHINNPGAIQTYVQLGFTTFGRRARFEGIA